VRSRAFDASRRIPLPLTYRCGYGASPSAPTRRTVARDAMISRSPAEYVTGRPYVVYCQAPTPADSIDRFDSAGPKGTHELNGAEAISRPPAGMADHVPNGTAEEAGEGPGEDHRLGALRVWAGCSRSPGKGLKESALGTTLLMLAQGEHVVAHALRLRGGRLSLAASRPDRWR